MNQKIENSIKVWSIIVGILSLSSLLTLAVYPIFSGVGIVAVIAILLGLAVLYAGVQVGTMSLKTVSAIFWTKFGWLILNFLLSLSPRGFSIVRLIIIVAQAIIVWFLIRSVKKLCQPEATASAQSAM